ncbi:hypothetical protein AKG07_03280 [Microbacterium sp. CGR1]|uniref:hypothetical protein n=1 Tax=Microbacterium sp. CGR1 TaxID=1696072 RepID=UPI00069F895A|nr:hypothetical protein [Microbacterium sp. CGR1]AKV85475.1 hypothetical protein AKG07_03280 [Microbacterium sp. CGR1]
MIPVARKAVAKTASLADRVESWSYGSTVTAVLVFVGIAVASDPDRLWGRNAWVFFAAAAAALVLIISAIAGPLIRLAIVRLHQRQRQ